MEAYIEEQMKEMRFELRNAFNESPMSGGKDFTFTRKESMVCEDYDAMLNKMLNEWEEILNDDRSCWSGVMEYTISCSIDNESGDSNGMPMKWDVSVEWCMDGFDNPFWAGDEGQ